MPHEPRTTAPGAPSITIQKATPDEAGTWVDEHRGYERGQVRMVTIAKGSGWQPATELDAALYEWARYPERERVPEALQAMDPDDLPEAWASLCDDVAEWFNTELAPPGHSFRWHEGGFYLFADRVWCRIDNPLRCDDAAHKHSATG
jgi:hypothetical protein